MTTDAHGHFAFDGLLPGEYVVSLESAFLDSLELSLPPPRLALASGEQKRLEFGVASGATLRALACPAVQLAPGSGAVSGRVWNAATERPLRGVSLSVRWKGTTVDASTLRLTIVPESAEVKTDSLGRFRVCGAPTDTYLDLQISADGYRTVLLQIVVSDAAGVAHQNIALGPEDQLARSPVTVDDTSLAVRVTDPRSSVLDGVVHGAQGPLRHVQVQVRGSSSVASTDVRGQYHLSGLLPGTHVLEVRRVGYLPRRLTIELRSGQNHAPELYLTPIKTLDSIRVVAQRPRYREFESRAKAASFGHFLRAEDIARKNPLLTSDLVRQMPGLRILRTGTSDLDVQVVSSRGTTRLNPNDTCMSCPALHPDDNSERATATLRQDSSRQASFAECYAVDPSVQENQAVPRVGVRRDK